MRVLIPFTGIDVESFKFKTGLVVSIIILVSWIIRLGRLIMEIPFKIRERKYKDHIQKLEYEKKIRQYKMLGISDEDIKELLNHKK